MGTCHRFLVHLVLHLTLMCSNTRSSTRGGIDLGYTFWVVGELKTGEGKGKTNANPLTNPRPPHHSSSADKMNMVDSIDGIVFGC